MSVDALFQKTNSLHWLKGPIHAVTPKSKSGFLHLDLGHVLNRDLVDQACEFNDKLNANI